MSHLGLGTIGNVLFLQTGCDSSAHGSMGPYGWVFFDYADALKEVSHPTADEKQL